MAAHVACECGTCHVLGPLSGTVSLTLMIRTQLLSISWPLLCVKCWNCTKKESSPQQAFFLRSFSRPSPHPEVTSCGQLSRHLSKSKSWDPRKPLGTIFVLKSIMILCFMMGGHYPLFDTDSSNLAFIQSWKWSSYFLVTLSWFSVCWLITVLPLLPVPSPHLSLFFLSFYPLPLSCSLFRNY